MNFTALPGPNVITFTLADGTGKVLSTFNATTIVQPTNLSTLNFTANPVVTSVALQLASTTVNGGSPAQDLLTVNAMDADGNVIVGNTNYVDVNGNPLSLLLNVSNSQAGGHGTVRIQGPLRITSPAQQAIYAVYDGNWLDYATISVSSSSAALITYAGATLSTIPTSYEYSYVANTAGHTLSYAQPSGITSGSDGNLWMTEFGGPCIAKIATTGIINEYCTGITAAAHLIYDVSGVDGNIWFLDYNKNKVGRIIPATASIVEYTGLAGNTPIGITAGPDGNIWFTQRNGNEIGKISTSGIVTNYPSAVVGSRAITVGPDGNLWFSTGLGSTLSRFTPQGVETDFDYGITCNDANEGIVTGPDGNIWFVACDDYRIGKSTLKGFITLFSTGITVGAKPKNLIVGPDNNMWFTESGKNQLGRITISGTVTEFPNGITGTAQPSGLTLGPDGNLWFTEAGKKSVGKFVL